MTGDVVQGWKLEVGDGASPEGFDEIEGITDFDGLSWDKAVIDMSSISDSQGSFEPGKPKVQPMSFTINFDPDNTEHQNLLADAKARTKRNYRITRTDDSPTSTQTFEAFVKSFGESGSDDDKISAAVELQPTGTVS